MIHQHWPLLLCSFPPAKGTDVFSCWAEQEQGVCGDCYCGCGTKYLLWRGSVWGAAKTKVVSQRASVEIPSKMSRIRDCWAASEIGGCVLRGVGSYSWTVESHGAAGLADEGQRCKMSFLLGRIFNINHAVKAVGSNLFYHTGKNQLFVCSTPVRPGACSGVSWVVWPLASHPTSWLADCLQTCDEALF